MSVAGQPSLRQRSGEFADYLDDWLAGVGPASLADVVTEAGGPGNVAIFCVDMINGFCHEGPLHGDRVRSLISPIVSLFHAAYEVGIRDFVLTHDSHSPDAAEFAYYPPHCISGQSESRIIPELEALPHAGLFTRIPKNSIHSGYGTSLDAWQAQHPQITHRIVVGDCTDLCTYQLAMHLHLAAVASNLAKPVILPVNCVDTYDVPVEVARSTGIPAHPADLLHAVFLYNMACNGVRIVSTLA